MKARKETLRFISFHASKDNLNLTKDCKVKR